MACRAAQRDVRDAAGNAEAADQGVLQLNMRNANGNYTVVHVT